MSAQLVAVPELLEVKPADALTSAVRSEFAVGTYLPEPDDPVLWGPACMVPDCPGGRVQMKEPRLCTTHLSRWRKQGKRDIGRFLRSDRVHPLPAASIFRDQWIPPAFLGDPPGRPVAHVGNRAARQTGRHPTHRPAFHKARRPSIGELLDAIESTGRP